MLVIVGPYPPPVHGASRVAQLLAAFATALGHSVTVIDTGATGGRAYHVRRLFRHLRAAVQLANLTRGARPVIWQTGAGGSGLWYQLMIVLVGRLLNSNQVLHHHSYAYLSVWSRAMSLIVKSGGSRLQHVVLSPDMGRKLASMYGATAVRVISNASFMAPAHPRSAGAGSRGAVGHLSNLTVAKGVATVLDAVGELRSQGLDVSLHLAGGTQDENLGRRILDHVSENPSDTWRGEVGPDAVSDFMEELDVFVFPSTYTHEALPLVVLEALQAGVPVVTTEVGCLPELLAEVDWLCGPDHTSVAAKVKLVLENPKSRSRALEVFESQRRPEQFEVLMEELMGR